jgi:hypothetical protein
MPNLLVPAKVTYQPRNFIEFLYSLQRLDETEFKAELEKMIADQPTFQTYFRVNKVNINSFLKSSKQFIFKILVENQAKANMFYIPPRKSRDSSISGVAYNGDILLLQWGNIEFSYFDENNTDYTPYTGNEGSRLILGTVSNPILYKTNNGFYWKANDDVSSQSYGSSQNEDGSWNAAKYYNVDCSKTVNFNFSVNLKYSAPGVVTALYLVPMKRYITREGSNDLASYKYYGPGTENANQSVDNLFNALASAGEYQMNTFVNVADEFGYGYNDAQGIPGSAQCSSIEIDIAEMTPVSFSLTLHGYFPDEDAYDLSGAQVNVHNFRGYPSRNVNCKLSRMTGDDYVEITEWPTWDTYGPSDKFTINTNYPFDVSATLTYDPVDSKLTAVVILTQWSTNKLKLEVTSGSEEFPVSSQGLDHMNVVVSNWAISGQSIYGDYYNSSTWWLDGFNVREDGTDFRGWVAESAAQKTKNSTYGDGSPWESEIAVAATQVLDSTNASIINGLEVSPYFQDYGYVYSMARAMVEKTSGMSNHVCFSGIFNLQIMVDGGEAKTNELPVWIMDAVYRGYVQEEDSTVDSSLYFNGRYQGAFGVIYDNPSTNNNKFNIVPKNNLVRSLADGYENAIGGGDFWNIQRNKKYNDNYDSSQYYSMANDVFYTDDTQSQSIKELPMKERFVLVETLSNEQLLTIKDAWNVISHGTNYLDAPSIMLNGALFQPPPAI